MPNLAPEDVILQLRRPTTLYTDQYLNDPIEVTTDQRFIPETALRQFEEISVVTRDTADFIEVVVGGTSPAIYPVLMQSPVYNRDDFTRIVDKTFKQLVTPNA